MYIHVLGGLGCYVLCTGNIQTKKGTERGRRGRKVEEEEGGSEKNRILFHDEGKENKYV
jgi:hypothetical protein